MNFHMNGMEKTVAELHGMLKTVKDSIKKNPNHVMMVQKEKKKRKCWTPLKGKGKEKVFDEPLSSKPKTKGKSGPSPDEECFHYHKRVIGSGTVRNTWRSKRRREVRILLQV
jgi:hypothetical protein